MKPGRIVKAILFRMLAVLLPALVLAAILEPIARRFDPALRLKEGTKNPFWMKDPILGHALKPGVYGSIWRVPFRINRLGFRGPEITIEKPANTFRIACLGDSVTMGSGLPEEVLYPHALQQILAEKYPHLKFQAINAGVSGYGIDTELLLLQEKIIPLSPDMVVLQFCLNDVPGTVFADHINPRRDIPFPAKKLLLAHSALARFIQERYNRIGLRNSFFGLADYLAMNPDSKSAQKINAAWKEYFSRLQAMAELCRENKIDFLLMVIPHQAEFEDRKHEFRTEKKIAEFTGKNHIPAVFAADAFLKEKSLPYAPGDPVHPDLDGHRILAELIADWLSQNSPRL